MAKLDKTSRIHRNRVLGFAHVWKGYYCRQTLRFVTRHLQSEFNEWKNYSMGSMNCDTLILVYKGWPIRDD